MVLYLDATGVIMGGLNNHIGYILFANIKFMNLLLIFILFRHKSQTITYVKT
jgi:hypothetical protein